MTNIEKFHFYLKDLESPTHFITWNYYYMIASCLARKVWWGDLDFPVYPNIYLIFVGEPAVGKSLPAVKVTEILRTLVKAVKNNKSSTEVELKNLVNLSPDSTTLESLTKELAESTEAIRVCENPLKLYVHSSMSFLLGEELGTLFRENTNDLIRFLTAGYNCGTFFRRATKHQGTDVINNICVNFLGCCTQDWVKKYSTDLLIQEGFSSRVIFLYGERPRKRTTKIVVGQEQKLAIEEVKKHLKQLCELFGEVKMSIDAWNYFDDWVQTKQDKIINRDPKLKFYYGRKKIHLIKMSILIHFSENLSMTIDKIDMEKALELLELTELHMHKALCSDSINPLQKISDEIVESLKAEGSGGLNEKAVLVRCWHGGSIDQITEALKFLTRVEQVKFEGGFYKLIN